MKSKQTKYQEAVARSLKSVDVEAKRIAYIPIEKARHVLGIRKDDTQFDKAIFAMRPMSQKVSSKKEVK